MVRVNLSIKFLKIGKDEAIDSILDDPKVIKSFQLLFDRFSKETKLYMKKNKIDCLIQYEIQKEKN